MEWFGELQIYKPMTLKVLFSNFGTFLLDINNFFVLCGAYVELKNTFLINSRLKLLKFLKTSVANVLERVTSIVVYLGFLSIIHHN